MLNFTINFDRPWFLLLLIPAVLLSLIPYLPVQNAPYVTKLVVLHFVFTLMNFFHNSFIGVNGLVAYMTPNSQERQKLYSIVPIITGFAPSIINSKAREKLSPERIRVCN